jgi:head-tail adaptor
MKAGTLRDRIRIDTPVETRDAAGAAAKAWQEVATVNAAIYPGAIGREATAGGTDFSEVSVSIRFREIPGKIPDPMWRFTDLDRGAIYSLVAVQRSRLSNEWTAYCKMGGARRP